jgi:hypothetical protein
MSQFGKSVDDDCGLAIAIDYIHSKCKGRQALKVSEVDSDLQQR